MGAPAGVTERLVRDVHPAEVALPDGRVLTNVRAFVTDRRLLVYWATPNRQIVRQLDAELEQPCSVPASRGTLSANARLEVRLADGSTAWVNRGRGCGCSSPLKALAAPVSWTGQ
ncbi:MAG TPA: hypothetical protein VFH80_10230 [Solirubrobacteraceae bacterium]|nr:hypothetical protein [Solirubrobacteraceae bacterium]